MGEQGARVHGNGEIPFLVLYAVALALALALQGNQSGCRLLEAAGIEIERTQVLLEVDVEPFALGGTGFVGRGCDQRGTDTSPPAMLRDHCVQDEGMDTTVPDNVHEADQRAVLRGTDPAETVALKSFSPVGPSDGVTEAVSVERVEGGVAEGAPPLVLDRHFSIVVSVPNPVTVFQGEGNSLADRPK
jgi:hypothetical protein